MKRIDRRLKAKRELLQFLLDWGKRNKLTPLEETEMLTAEVYHSLSSGLKATDEVGGR